jgi:hypothetical protein
MAVLSVDLATRRWSDLGIVVLDRTVLDQAVLDRARPAPFMIPTVGSTGLPLNLPHDPLFTRTPSSATAERPIRCEIILSSEAGAGPGPVEAEILAGRLNHLCGVRGIRVLMLDGPQAWKSRSNGLEYARVSERQLNTAAKTGLPGMVKPVSCRPYAEFCLDLYDALCRRGWRRLATREQPGAAPERVLVESCPRAAWKSLGLKPLPAKRRSRVSDLAEAYAALRSLFYLSCNRPPNHDQLQAIVGGFPGLALEERSAADARIVGSPPRREEGHWREGFIVLPVPPVRSARIRWLN